jgi:hypothetical protein
MRLTCRPPERLKTKNKESRQPLMAAIPPLHPPASPVIVAPSSLPATPLDPALTPSQFLPQSAPPTVLPIDHKLYQPSSTPARPPSNDILKRIIKSDGGIKKKSHPHAKSKGGDIVPPPPLSKYKRPPPIVPHKPGERYALGIPYVSSLDVCLIC